MICFFFQAEDGIRDDLVTGVQTCALPILRGPFIEFSILCRIILTKKREIAGEILHETEVIIHGVSILDLDWAEVIGIDIHFSKTWGFFH